MMGLCGRSDWRAHEVIKEEPACAALNKASLSLLGHYMREAVASKAQPPHVLHFPSLTHSAANRGRSETQRRKWTVLFFGTCFDVMS